MMKKKLTILLFLLVSSRIIIAGEGMWLPILLGQLNEKEMRDMGMRITAEDIYSVNQSSLKDAVVLFGGGCTAEMISSQGLLLTNHHCGYSNIQRHSSLERDYLANGFWAQRKEEELPNPGLSVTFLISMKEVTSEVVTGILPMTNEKERDAIVKRNFEKLVAEATKGTHYKASVKAFYNGNQYYLFLTETFTDVRLVGAPPSSIGKFGGDTDNWMWPRHTGDFALFRIYANKDNEPADYSKDNIPYQPRKFFTISTKGINEGDFTFVYGFPGSTQEYLPSYAIDLATNIRNPIAIELREQRLDIIGKAMEKDHLVRIQYAAKSAGIANFYKKMIGESRGIKKLDGIGKKQSFEAEFTSWVNRVDVRKVMYGNLLSEYKAACEQFKPYHRAYTYLTEGALGIEIIRYAYGFNTLVKQCRDKSIPDTEIIKATEKLKAGIDGYYKNYYPQIDQEVFSRLMRLYTARCEKDFRPGMIGEATGRYDNDFNAWAKDVFNGSMFSNAETLKSYLNTFSRKNCKKLEKDPVYQLAESVYRFLQSNLATVVNEFYSKADSLQRVYMKAQMEMQPERRFYPDANSTLRVSYGNIQGYSPDDAIHYNWFTTLDGIIQKEDPEIPDYQVDPRLKELHKNKDFGSYADASGTMHVAFIGTNHTTGGNSGSPVLNADGELIGINFDRCWEGTMSDLMYDPDQCRNIALDIRYCLFIIDKFAGAGWLLNEMNISAN